MKAAAFIPKPAEVSKEALVVILGAVVAAFVIGRMPPVREWIKRQWDGAPGA